MGELTEAQIDAALARGEAARLNEPRAMAARYNRKLGRVVVELTNGCSFTFPPQLAQGLEKATDEQLAQVEIIGRGFGLHWEALDTDLSVPGLLAGLFGTKAYMARQAGQAKSPAKAAAARANGAKGGRPARSAKG
jgi:hypothetical protein